jgi:hypothetical protein
MSKVFSKFKRTAITELVNSTDQRTITSVAIANGGTNYAVNDVLEIAGGTVLKVTTVNAGATNAISSINVVASGTYSDFTALSNVAVYNVSNSVANSVYGGQQTVSGANLRINVALDTNAVKTNRFYMLAAGTTEQESVPLEKETEYDSFLNIWEETVFGKSAGLIPVARRVNWEANTFYSAYDDRDELLSTKDFFVIDSGSKEIYKCIDNGATVSNTEPLSANNPGEYLSIISGTPFTLSDGYTWLYMGTVNTQVDDTYGTTSYFPVQEYANTKSAAINGGLFSIRVSSIGDNYVTTSGKTTVPAGSSTNRVRLSGAVTNPSYYSNSAIVVANTSGGVEVKRIDLINIVSVGAEVYSEVELAASENFTAGFLQNNQDYILAPYVEIESKTGSGAIAYPIVANDGSIERIEMVNYGSGYKDATAIVGTAPGIGSGAVLRPVISPGNGHGSHIFDELFVDSVCISSKFDESNFPLEPKYNTLALLKNPTYANGSPFYGTSFVQTIEIPLQDNGVTGLTLGELIVGNNIDANTGRNPSGQVAFSNSTLLQVTGVDGMFVHISSLTGQTSGEIVYTANLLNWDTYFGTSNTGVGSEDYDVKLYSGDVLYAKNVQEITRNSSSDEQIKIVIKL